MEIREREPGDVAELTRRAAGERDALRPVRYRAVLMAIGGDEAAGIAAALGRARRSVQDRAYISLRTPRQVRVLRPPFSATTRRTPRRLPQAAPSPERSTRRAAPVAAAG